MLSIGTSECLGAEKLSRSFPARLVEGLEEGVFRALVGDGRGRAVSREDIDVSIERENLGEDALHQGGVVAAREVAAANAAGKERVSAEEDFPAQVADPAGRMSGSQQHLELQSAVISER